VIDANFVDRIVALRDDATVKEVGGVNYSVRDLKPVYFEPRPDAVEVLTLTGLADYIEKNVDELKRSELMLHVVDPKTVKLVSKICGVNRKRDDFAEAKVDEELEEYPFGKFMPTEEFVIRLRSMFSPTTDLERVIAFTSRLVTGATLPNEDDGITQTATVKVGVTGALKTSEAAPIIINLKPFRTFRELDQVESEFLFRVRVDGEGKPPVCALFEADGGRWRNFAVLAIRDWLAEKIQDIAIIA
jgi:hypothetical protein